MLVEAYERALAVVISLWLDPDQLYGRYSIEQGSIYLRSLFRGYLHPKRFAEYRDYGIKLPEGIPEDGFRLGWIKSLFLSPFVTEAVVNEAVAAWHRGSGEAFQQVRHLLHREIYGGVCSGFHGSLSGYAAGCCHDDRKEKCEDFKCPFHN